MVSSLVRAESAFKDICIHSFHHMHTRMHTCTHACTHTHARMHARMHAHTLTCYRYTCITGDSNAEEERWVFSFDSKEESEDKCLTERGRGFQVTGLMY